MKFVATYKKLTILFSVLLFVVVSFLIWQEIQDMNRRKREQLNSFPNDLQQIKSAGVLKAAVDYNSTNYFIYRGKPMGFEYELLQALCNDLGVKLEIVVSNSIGDSFEGLKTGRFDLVARNITITKDRTEFLDFTIPLNSVKQVLVQRIQPEASEKVPYINSVLELAGKQITVQKNSSHHQRLLNLSEEIGGKIELITDSVMGAEDLIAKVASGEIDYTVCDHNIGKVNQFYFPNIDISVQVSLEQNVAWAVRKGSADWKNYLDTWITEFAKTRKFNHLYYKYFESPRVVERKESDFNSISGGKISKFDATIKQVAKELGWDWRLIAAVIYHESRFNENAGSWTGAYGLMQLMPSTAEAFGITDIGNPKQNIKAGVLLLNSLNKQFVEIIPDSTQRVRFVLAAYNIGLGHVTDAQRLAEKYGKNPNMWENNVETYLQYKSEEKYFKDPVVRWGYCRGDEAARFVANVSSLYQNYRNVIGE
jgi:membrane-bound lytic murein transglycosylase F